MEEMAEENRASKSSKYQYFLMFVCWFVYMFAQLGRYSYNANTTLIMDKFAVDHTAAGLPATLFFFAYGLGQIVVGLLCSKYNTRIMISAALATSGLMNLLIFFGNEFLYIKYLWFLNGLAQANLWPVLLLVLRENVDAKKMPLAALIMSTASTGGRFVAIGVCALFAIDTSIFTYSFFVASMALFAMAVLWFASTRDVRKSKSPDIGLKTEEKVKNKVSWDIVIILMIFAEFSMASYAVSGGLQQWVPAILKENFGLKDWIAMFMSVMLPLFMMTSAFIAAFLFKLLKNYVLISIIMFALCFGMLVATVSLLDTTWLPIIILLTGECISMSIVSHFTSVQVPLMFEGKLNAGFLAGFLNGCCYIGMGLSTYVLGSIADKRGWIGSFGVLMLICIVSFLLSLVYLIVKRIQEKKRKS